MFTSRCVHIYEPNCLQSYATAHVSEHTISNLPAAAPTVRHTDNLSLNAACVM